MTENQKKLHDTSKDAGITKKIKIDDKSTNKIVKPMSDEEFTKLLKSIKNPTTKPNMTFVKPRANLPPTPVLTYSIQTPKQTPTTVPIKQSTTPRTIIRRYTKIYTTFVQIYDT